jgi:uncharacterized protein YyaL (SSP411 family)
MTARQTNKPNHLINEKSPYLLQHAYNPVEWYPWSQEAFEKARSEDKPIFLSIGYSTCHWCHVMEKESFEDEEVAKLLNDEFISIKVDREERPDIDSIYMDVSQMLLGSGGWPLNVFLTADKKPFYASTYIPKHSNYMRVGMVDMIPRIKNAWYTKREMLLESANEITTALHESQNLIPGKDVNVNDLDKTFNQLNEYFDERNGGFGKAPKFPTAHNLLFLLRYWRRTGEERALRMVEKTLTAMRLGGIYDHVGYGFHRYSTDSQWLLPHFEKMLYDQALIAMAYLEAYQATGNHLFECSAKEIFAYVFRSLKDKKGGFYAGEDADSEGEEGKYYVWKTSEIRELLDEDESALVIRAFNLEEDGNFYEEATRRKTGTNIFFMKKTVEEVSEELEVPEDYVSKNLGNARRKLLAKREKRVHPHLDDKVLTDWNGLMIAALAKGAQILDKSQYYDVACQATDFIIETMLDDKGQLLHRYRDGETAINGFIDDYAFFIWGLLELYETNFDIRYLKLALKLMNYQLQHFWDEENGGFYINADNAENLITRKKEIYDGAIPSGNSISMLNMLRIARITGDTSLEKQALQISKVFSEKVKKVPLAYTQLMSAVDFALAPAMEVVIAGDKEAEDTQILLRTVRSLYIPNKILLLKPVENGHEIEEIATFTKHQNSFNNVATAYVCYDYSCKHPTSDADEMLGLLTIGT